jgi:hypothetical protein
MDHSASAATKDVARTWRRRSCTPPRYSSTLPALVEKLARLARTRLAEECHKLEPAEGRRLADEALGADTAWPEY